MERSRLPSFTADTISMSLLVRHSLLKSGVSALAFLSSKRVDLVVPRVTTKQSRIATLLSSGSVRQREAL